MTTPSDSLKARLERWVKNSIHEWKKPQKRSINSIKSHRTAENLFHSPTVSITNGVCSWNHWPVLARFGVFPGISMNQNDYKRIDFCFGSDNWKIVIHKMHECTISSWTKFAFVWFHTKIPYFNLLNHANGSLYSSKIWSILSAILLLAKKIKFQKIYLDEQRENGAIWKTWNFGQKKIKFCYCCRVHSFEVLTMSKFCTF